MLRVAVIKVEYLPAHINEVRLIYQQVELDRMAVKKSWIVLSLSSRSVGIDGYKLYNNWKTLEGVYLLEITHVTYNSLFGEN